MLFYGNNQRQGDVMKQSYSYHSKVDYFSITAQHPSLSIPLLPHPFAYRYGFRIIYLFFYIVALHVDRTRHEVTRIRYR